MLAGCGQSHRVSALLTDTNDIAMQSPIRVVQYGLGPIGIACASTLLRKEATGRIKLVGAIDIDPDKVGKDLATLLQQDAGADIVVSADSAAVLQQSRPHVVLHTTGSFLERVETQMVDCLEAGAHVVSSSEELSFPYDRHPAIARRLDEAARAHRAVILGTGVNPGYAMDALALFATGACVDVQRVRVDRVVDASLRREPLQRKIGAGLTPADVEKRKKTGSFGHIGLRESLLLVASGLGWTLDHVEESLDAVLAEESVQTQFVHVPAGCPAGIHQRAVGYRNGAEALTLDLKMYVGAAESYDAVVVEGTPPVDVLIRGGVFGDTATVAALVNAIPSVMAASPGLHTVNTLPLPCAFATT